MSVAEYNVYNDTIQWYRLGPAVRILYDLAINIKVIPQYSFIIKLRRTKFYSRQTSRDSDNRPLSLYIRALST